ncbi:MAG TPA: two-component regulator propeller domain-containing protein, partial [Bryobacteraceae bacterium]|nr:two-component regulator propeller domain-containing protein [Bryobacteraceae bacterium]
LYMDREGTLWAGTKDGLDQFTDGSVTPYTTNEGLLSNETGPVLEDRSGRLWVGTLGWGLNIMENGHVHALTTRNGLAGDVILSLELGKDGDLWVGTSNGVSRLHDGQVIATYRRRDGIPGDAVNSLVVDSGGVLWAGTNRGLARFEDGRFVSASLTKVPNDTNVIALARGNTTRLFVSTDSPGFYTLHGDTFSSHDLGVARPVDSIFLDTVRRAAWMGTLGAGLLRWQNGNVARVRVRDGLYDNRIYDIIGDSVGNFWISSSKGIFRVSRAQLDSLADGKTRVIDSMPFSTGQLRFECRSGVQPAACRTSDGRLWFSTTSGLVMIDPASVGRKYPPPPTQITSVLANGERVSAIGALKFKPGQKNVEIRYAGLSFVSPEKVTFRYKLEGFDKEWTEAGPRREAFFTNLPPKQYRFVVYARNANGDVSAIPASADFTVEPTFYQQLWFFPLVGMALVAAAYFVYRMRMQHLRQRFDLVLAERSRIARELHDTLLQGLSGVTMQLQALWMRMPPSRDKQFLSAVIEDAAACSQEARQSLWGLRTQGPRSQQFTDKLANVCREVVEESGVALDLDLQPIGLQSLPETEYQLLRIAREVVSNTVAHADAAVLRVRLAINKGQLHLSFEDNGIGFDAQNGVQLLDHFGLVGIRERAKEIGADLDLNSTPGTGTTIKITLPLTNLRGSESNAEASIEHHTR